MSTTTVVIIIVIVLAFVLAFAFGEHPKRPQPQDPPSDKARFDAIKRDWQDKQ